MHAISPDQPSTATVAAAPPLQRISVHRAVGDLLEIVAVAVDLTQSTLQVEGELDIASADLLSASVDVELDEGRRFVRLDLSRLSFMDCTGLRAVVHAHNRCLAAGGTLALTDVRPPVTRLLHITGLDEALFIADSPSISPPHTPARHLAAVRGRR